MSLINDALKRAGQSQKEKPALPREPAPALQPVGDIRPRGSHSLFFAAGALVVIALGLGGWFIWIWAFGKSNAARAVPVAAAPSPMEAAKPITSGTPKTETAHEAKMPSDSGRLPAEAAKNLNIASAPVSTGATQAEVEALEKKIFTGAQARIVQPAVPEPAPAPPAKSTPSTNAPAIAPVASAPAVVTVPDVAGAAPASVKPTPPVSPPPAPPPFPALKLQGIFFRRTNPTVLINGQTISEGETVDEVQVIKIERNSVTVQWNGQQRVLRLP